jgi:trigger factor
MEIQVTELEPCKLSVHYEADAGQILNKRGDILDQFKKAPVPGFRKGKASVDAIKYYYKDQIEEALKRALVEDAYHNTLFEKKLKAHGAPKITSAQLRDGKFACEFEMFTKPEFEIAPYKDLDLVKPAHGQSIVEMTEELLQQLRMRHGIMEPYTEDDFVQENDNVILNYEGFIGSERIENFCAEGEPLTVGASLLKDFDNNLLGMKLGETREFIVNVPKDGLPSLAGRSINFKVDLVIGSKNVPCPLNDELALKLNKKDFSELREYVQGIATAKIQDTEKQAQVQAISEKLVADNVFTVPNWILLSEAQYLAHQSHLKWDDMPDLDKEKYLQVADKNTRLALVLDKIREDEPEAQLSDQEIFEMIKQRIVLSKPKEPVEDILKNMTQTGYLQILFQRIKDEYTLDFVVKSGKLIE